MEICAASHVNAGIVVVSTYSHRYPKQQLRAFSSSPPTSRCTLAVAPAGGILFRCSTIIGPRRGCQLRIRQFNIQHRRRCFSGGNEGNGNGERENEEERENNGIRPQGNEIKDDNGESPQKLEKKDVDAKENLRFWGRWLGNQRQPIESDASKNKDKDSPLSVDEAADKSPGGADEGNGVKTQTTEIGEEEETSPRRGVPKKEKAVAGIWSRLVFWKTNEEEDDDELEPDEKLILRDLESVSFNWKELFDPTVENILALGLTALLAAAFFKIFMQLFGVIATILVTAAKYTVLATILLGLLIFIL